MPTVDIIIKPNGQATVEAFGYTGPSCLMVTTPFLVALGVQTGQMPKSEMYEEQTQEVHQ